MNCTHPVLYSRNCVLYCQICGAVIDSPKAEKPPEGTAQAATDGNATKPRRPKNPAKDTAKKEEKNANG
jgi:hypothetical protein